MVAGDELERAGRLLQMLRTEAERRKTFLARSGATSLSEHLASDAGERLPYILVVLDGYSGYASVFEDVDGGAQIQLLRTLVAEGRPLGIAFVITTDPQASYLSKLAATVGRRLVLRLASDTDYGLLGVPKELHQRAELPPGRGFLDARVEVQCAVVGTDPAGGAQAAAIVAVATELSERYGQVEVPRVRLLPTHVSRASLPAPRSALESVVGLQDQLLQAAVVDLAEGHLLIAGPNRSGRTTALATVAASLARRGEADLYLLVPRRQSQLPTLLPWVEVGQGLDACSGVAARLAARLRDATSGPARPQVVIVDDGDALSEGIDTTDLDWLAQRGPEHGVRIVVGVDNEGARRSYATWLRQVARDRQGLLLDPDTTMDGALLGNVRLPPHRGPALPPGRGYLVRRGRVDLVQVAGD